MFFSEKIAVNDKGRLLCSLWFCIFSRNVYEVKKSGLKGY
jgi:hypothetical protein